MSTAEPARRTRVPDTLDRRQLLAALRKLARGELAARLPDDRVGVDGEICAAFNEVARVASALADDTAELRVAVGTEGLTARRLAGADRRGGWGQVARDVNGLLDDLTAHSDEMARVVSAVARGDLAQRIGVDDGTPLKGQFLLHARAVNGMADQLALFGSEVTRVATEVGVEGKLGARAHVPGVSGAWKELTESVNLMASHLTIQVREIARVTTAVAQGDLTKTVEIEVKGEILALKNTINTMVGQLSSFADEVTRVAREVGTDGLLGGQARVRGVSGVWKDLTDSVNSMADNLTNQVRNIAEVASAIANGDLSKEITVDAQGEILELKDTINTMVDQLSSFGEEVARVAREVGIEGKLGGKASVRGVRGIWKELTDNVNVMAENLTAQVRDIARVATAIAEGDLTRKIAVEVRGEMLQLKETMNDMLVTLSTFADQVTRVAHDVGVEGRLGGQADVPGAAGIWFDLTNNVNELAGNLTRQVRAIGDVATAVTRGNLTQTIDVDARGEVALLKDNLNQMIRTLAETTRINQEQDWLKTNLARFTRMLQGQRDLLTVASQVLGELAPTVGAQHGVFYLARHDADVVWLDLVASYAGRQHGATRFALGEGLVGEVAQGRKRIVVNEAPPHYVRVESGLGEAAPLAIVVVPVLFETDLKGVIELASFQRFTPVQLDFLDQLLEPLGIVVATIEATMRTDELLRESQRMAEELKDQQEELQLTNEELEHKARELTQQRDEVERKNQEVERARQELEDQAEKLALTSRYKSQFLANMSHELRTPLNSMLILSQQLAQNREAHLSEREVEYARTIHQAGGDLLALINEVLDLAKVESGKMAVEIGLVAIAPLVAELERTFSSVAEQRGLALVTRIEPGVPDHIVTDEMRCKQVLRNLLSNAMKFTDHGSVRLTVRSVHPDEVRLDRTFLRDQQQLLAFEVRDTGIGIPKDKHQLVFEAFQQAEGGTSRKYGGTGLGLSISRDITGLLGGELHLESEPGRGSVFTLYVPPVHPGRSRPEGRRRPTSLPVDPPSQPSFDDPTERSSAETRRTLDDDRRAVQPGDRVLLVVEDDRACGQVVMDLARARGFKVVRAETGEEAVELARGVPPDAITLDLGLPDMDGWVLLDRLVHDPATRHVPVHVLTASPDERRGRAAGAVAVTGKPASEEDVGLALERLRAFLEPRPRRLLVAVRDPVRRGALVALVAEGGPIETVLASTAAEASLHLASEEPLDCVVVDPDGGGVELVREVRSRRPWMPVVAVVAELVPDGLAALADAVVVEDEDGPQRFFAAAARFLHLPESALTDAGRRMLARVAASDPALQGQRVLVVDDDVRNVFALTAVLERHGMLVEFAENGRQALERLDAPDAPDVDVVLMDIMMPEMDGYETTRHVRLGERFADLPIVALTAKAMKGDRERCIAAGASDYVTKPVDTDQLVSLLRVWLYR